MSVWSIIIIRKYSGRSHIHTGVQIYTEIAPRVAMASMLTCACGWTIVSPQGENDVKKHTVIHLHDTHPGTIMTEEEIMKMMKTI